MSERVLASGAPVPEDGSHTEIDPRTGMQKGYIVLTAEERAKGFVKPVRHSYRHVGPPVPANLRDLTEEERLRHDPHGGLGYAKYEEYGPERSPLVGRFWTQAELDRVTRRCNAVTKMGYALAETYARDPKFYSGTFCCACRMHYPLNEFIWEPDGEPMDVSLQDAWHEERRKQAIERAQQQLADAGARARADWERRRQRLRAELDALERDEPIP
jgi:hypothetical protein